MWSVGVVCDFACGVVGAKRLWLSVGQNGGENASVSVRVYFFCPGCYARFAVPSPKLSFCTASAPAPVPSHTQEASYASAPAHVPVPTAFSRSLGHKSF